MKKSSFLAVLLMFVACTFLQAAQIGSWNVYLSYHNATKNVAAGKVIYTVANGDLYSYNTEDTEVRTYDNLGILNDVDIVDIGYSQEAKKIILIYSNCNIDLLDADDNVQNLSALKEKSLLGKEISSMYIYGSIAYLSTGFGLIEVDMKEGVFLNTYRLGFDAKGVAVNEDKVYLATTTGLYVCSKENYMQDNANWTIYQGNTDWNRLFFFGGKLMGIRNDGIYSIDSQSAAITNIYNKTISFIRETNGMLFWGNADEICYTSDLPNYTTIKESNTWSDVTYQSGTYWVSDQYKGLQGYKINDKQMQVSVSSITPNSPVRNLSYRLNWVGNRLLVAGGINTVAARSFYKLPTAMYMENGQWTNFEEMSEIPENYKNLYLANTTDLVQDPTDPSHHYASLHRNGLFEYRDGKFVRFFNSDNSPLSSILPMSKNYMNYVSCAGLKYDAEGNLWMLCSQTDTVVRVMRPDGTWAGLYYEPIDHASLCDNILIHSTGLAFFTSRRMEMRGIFCLNTQGTLANFKDDNYILRQEITNQDETVYNPDEFYGICEDLDGKIWFGTNLGLFVIDDPTTVFDRNFRFTQVKVNRNDGSDLADYLLSGLPVTCIAVDGANRKWVGTLNNGVFLISADGQETIHHFTTADSPLLSDAIQDIAVNSITGEVAIGTENGLCSFMSDATEAADELVKDNVLVYPNPVKSDYTGPIAIKGLTMDAEVKILSSSGQLVWKGVSSGGLATWNGCNMSGKRVASGIYHVVANNNAGDKAIITRIVIIK